MRDQERGDRITPPPGCFRNHGKRRRQIHQHAEQSALVFDRSAVQHHEAKAAVQEHQQRRNDRCQLVAQHHQGPPVNQADKRDAENEVLDEHRWPQVSATADKDGRDEVGDEGIGETNSGVCRIFRWKIVAECKTRDDADVKRKIAEVIQQSGAESVLVLYNCTAEHSP